MRKVKLTELGGGELRLGTRGVSFRIEDANHPEQNGTLRIGKGKVFWTDARQGSREVEKKWKQFIDFMRS